MTRNLSVSDIQHLWIALIWARNNGFDQTNYDNQYLHAAEAKLQASFDALTAVTA